MRTRWIGTSLILMLAATQSARTQEAPAAPADDFKPYSTNVVGQQYPQVNSARQAKFRIVAPGVQSIRVLGTNLVKDDNGVFTRAARKWQAAGEIRQIS